MRVQFTFNPEGGTTCPVCGKGTPEPAILVPINAEKRSRTVEAVQVHVECVLDNIEYLSLGSGNVLIAYCEYPYREGKP